MKRKGKKLCRRYWLNLDFSTPQSVSLSAVRAERGRSRRVNHFTMSHYTVGEAAECNLNSKFADETIPIASEGHLLEMASTQRIHPLSGGDHRGVLLKENECPPAANHAHLDATPAPGR
jgi:hypothetical protein